MSESHPSQGVTGIDNGSSDKEFSCPKCGDVFDTDAGVKQHHYAAHGESIAGELIECDWCGDTKRKRPSQVNEEHNFCGRDCWADWYSEYKRNKVAYECDYCGNEFQIHPFRLEQADMHFCPGSDKYSKCYSNWVSENRVGENSPQWDGGGVTVSCSWCGDEKQVGEWRLARTERFFCTDKECSNKWKSENRSGEDNPQYDPHKTNQYGPNWDEQAEKCRKRDDHRCQSCGKHQRDNYRALIAHHITPRKRFIGDDGIYDYEEGNKLGNLVSLCDSCHQQWEGLYLKPQLV